ncbi:MAG: nuclear transport factor 2 family protein [Anaerolineae bacterium]|nr:nuclear transport factor 2 family protein [Anaerolineae bacterium]
MNPTKQAIIAVVKARSAALVTGNVAALERILHPDFVYVNSYGLRLNRADYLGNFANADGSLKWQSQDLSDIEIRLHGDTAIVNCRIHDVFHWGEELVEGDFQSTFVYIRSSDGWQCVAGHTSDIVSEE